MIMMNLCAGQEQRRRCRNGVLNQSIWNYLISTSYIICLIDPFSSVQSLSRVQLFVTAQVAARRPPCSSPTPGVYSNSCPLSQ